MHTIYVCDLSGLANFSQNLCHVQYNTNFYKNINDKN